MTQVEITIHGKAALATPEHAKILIRKNKLVLEAMKLRQLDQTPAVLAERGAVNRKIIAMNRKIQREGIHCIFTETA